METDEDLHTESRSLNRTDQVLREIGWLDGRADLLGRARQALYSTPGVRLRGDPSLAFTPTMPRERFANTSRPRSRPRAR